MSPRIPPPTEEQIAATERLQARIQKSLAAVAAMPVEEREKMWEQQKKSFVRGEMGMGFDREEADYRDALHSGDQATLDRLNQKEPERRDAFDAAKIEPPTFPIVIAVIDLFLSNWRIARDTGEKRLQQTYENFIEAGEAIRVAVLDRNTLPDEAPTVESLGAEIQAYDLYCKAVDFVANEPISSPECSWYFQNGYTPRQAALVLLREKHRRGGKSQC